MGKIFELTIFREIWTSLTIVKKCIQIQIYVK